MHDARNKMKEIFFFCDQLLGNTREAHVTAQLIERTALG